MLEATSYLLRFVEAMNFINEQDGPPLAQSELILCLLDNLTNIINGCAGGREGYETSCPLLFTGAGDYVGESGLKKYTNKYKYLLN